MSKKKYLIWIFPIIWLFLTVFLSAQTGSESGVLSSWLSDHIRAVFNISPDNQSFETALRNCAHYITHLILAVLVVNAIYYDTEHHKPIFAIFTGFFSCAAIGVFDELIQFAIPERCFEVFDIARNIIGVTIATLYCTLRIALISLSQSKPPT
jgi:VanZ family protein